MAHKRRIAPGGTRGTRFQAVARIRLQDANVLLEHRRFLGALYLAGYAIECALKWAVTQRQGPAYLPRELEVHKWDDLVQEAGLDRSLKANAPLSAMFTESAELWRPELRYESKEPAQREAERLYRQIKQVYDWINEQTLQ
jgi:hypothetical protein